MRRRSVAISAVFAVLAATLTSCGSTSDAATGAQGSDGLAASWSLTSAAISSSRLSDFAITLNLHDTTASGFGGVNQYSTTFTSAPDGDLDFGEIASTRMGGSPDAMAAEQAYFAALGTITGYTVSGGELDLFAGEQEMLTYSLSQ